MIHSKRSSGFQHHSNSTLDNSGNPDYRREGDSDFSQILSKNLDRRGFLKGSIKIGMTAFLTTIGASGGGLGVARAAKPSQGLSSLFKPVKASTADTVTVPEGFDWDVLIRWGDPLWSKGSEFDEQTRGSGASQELACGDNNDGMALFTTKEGHHILAVNNEYTNPKIIYGNRASKLPENKDDLRKGKAAHGVSVMEIRPSNGQWHIVKDSRYNRRITMDTPIEITGPLRGYAKLKTKADPNATLALGTWSNCGSGRTPWGTYLTCEENFNGYFLSSDRAYKPSGAMKRYGLGRKNSWPTWDEVDERFDISKHPNEPNRVGYVVEIDPTNPDSTPKKLTALGRLKHENAEVVLAQDKRVVVYMGDDERGEYLYRFISEGKYSPGSKNNHALLTQGSLYAAKFHPNGKKGEWLELTPKTTRMSVEEICLHTRMAASAVKATTMDRPEWVAASPDNKQVMCCLTNNKYRGIKANKGGDATPVEGPNPRKENHYGQIVRWRPNNADHGAKDFTWDLFVMAGNPTTHKDDKSGSSNITADNMFNSPDGLAFDKNGRLWIQSDGDYSNQGDFAGMGNNQMLIGDPQTGEIQRFLVGPKECEVTGIAWSPDYKTVFVGIQHPGAEGKGNSHFPQGGNSVPRSSVIAVRRKDGTEIL